MTAPDLIAFARAVSTGEVRVIDLTQTLAPDFRPSSCRPNSANANCSALEEVSRYDERGPAWYWNNFSSANTPARISTHRCIGSRAGPAGQRDGHDPAVRKFIAPACVIDCRKESTTVAILR